MTLSFTRLVDGYRANFVVVRRNGLLRENIPSSMFTVNVIDPTDTTTTQFSVSESVVKPGSYYFDIPATYLISSGTGLYPITIEVNATTAPRVRASFSDTLKVFEHDFDSLNTSISGSANVTQADVDFITSGVWNAVDSTFNVSGTMGRLQNNIATGGVDVDLLVSGVWLADNNTFNSPDTMGWLMNKMIIASGSIEKIRKIETGRWKISGSQQIFYDDDGVTPVAIMNLYTTDGSPFIHDQASVVERDPTGSVA